MSITTHLDGTLWAITDGTDMNDPVSWLYADAAGVAEPAPGSIVVRADLEAAKVAVATARREAVKVAAVANASARAHHRRTTTADLAVAARKRAKGFVSREGLRVATAFTRGAVSVTVTDRRKPRKTVRKVRINNRGIAVA
jgi:predicted Zn-dependent protease